MQYLQCDLSCFTIIYEVEFNEDNCHIEILFQFDCFSWFLWFNYQVLFYIKLCNKVSFTRGSEHINILLPPPQVANWDLHITSKILALSLSLVVLYRTIALISIKSFFEDNRSLPPNENLSIWTVTTSIYWYKFYIGQEFLINSEYELIETVIAQQYKQQRSTWNMKCNILMTLVHMLQFLNAIQSSKIFYKLSKTFAYIYILTNTDIKN